MWNIGFTGADNDLIILSVKGGQKFALELFGVNGYIKKAGDAANTPGQAGQVPRLITVSTQVSAPRGMESSNRGDFVYRRLIQRATITTRTPATVAARMSKRNCSIGASFQEDLPRSQYMKSDQKRQAPRDGALGVWGVWPNSARKSQAGLYMDEKAAARNRSVESHKGRGTTLNDCA